MLPLSAKDIVSFTPLVDQLDTLRLLAAAADASPDTPADARAKLGQAIASLESKIAATPQPVYRLAVPTLLQRAAWRRDVRAEGATYPGDAQLYQALRDDLALTAPANLDSLLAVIDDVEAANGGEVNPDPDALRDLEAIARLARGLIGGAFAALEADREYWLNVAPIVACRHFLLGWDHVPAPFERVNGRTSDASLDALGDVEMRAVGNKIMGLMRPDRAAVGNSESPSPSASSPRPTPAASAPPTVPPGASSANGTTATPACS